MIQMKNVIKSFDGPNGKVTALNNISFSVSPGELLAVSGPSGCGKTTLLLTASGMLRPDQGSVEIMGGKNVYDLSQDRRSRMRAEMVGFVFQQFHLIPYLTVRENVIAPSLSVSRHDPDQHAQELINQFGLQERADHIPSQLSTGERQRAALARALFNQPKIILADEPTGNLDDENAEIVLKHLRDFVSAGGSVLLVTHNARAAEYATRSLKMKNGLLAADGR
jgi:ABC-type lipoprotein export system ATPase subunit